jgi:hypothetical protein
MDWDKEEQVKLAKEVATKCHSIFNFLVDEYLKELEV